MKENGREADAGDLIERVDTFHTFLVGGPAPEGFTLPHRPRKMSAESAMAVIYLIQEFLKVLPDSFEMCRCCHRIFDTYEEGHSSDENGSYCEEDAWRCKCSECRERSREKEEQ